MALTEKMSDAQALRCIKQALGAKGFLIVHPHAAAAMEERGFDDNDLRSAIRRGRIVLREPDSTRAERFTVEGPSADGPPIVIWRRGATAGPGSTD